jgi:branched-chain amino acid aminotransferase
VLVFLNGQFVPEAQAVVPVNDRGFMYGDGLFETLRVCGGRPFRLTQHLERLMRGADFLKIQCPFSLAELQEFAGQVIERNQMSEAILRLVMTRGPGERGYTPRADGRPTVVMTLHPAPPPYPPVSWSLVTSSYRIPAADPLAAFKTLNKLTHIMARREAVEQGADEALLFNTNGEAVEATSGNLFWAGQDCLCTVPLGQGALPGITRAVVLEICRTLGFPAGERTIKPEALQNASGLFITQSALGIVPVTSFNGRPVIPSPQVDRMARAYHALLAGPAAG